MTHEPAANARVAHILADQPLPWLGGLTASEFLRDYWQKKPLFVRGAFPQLATLLAPEELLELAESDDVESRLIQEHGKTPWTVEDGPFEPVTWRKRPAQGWTVLVQAVDHYLPPLADVLDHFAFIPEWRMDDVMVSYAVPGGSVGPHVDQYDVFLIQGPGRRQWQLGEMCDEHTPRQDHERLRLLVDMPVTWSEIVEPGDLLYVPPGLGHHGVALDTCLTYSVGFRAPATLQLLECVTDYLSELPVAEALVGDADRMVASHACGFPLADVARCQQQLLQALADPKLLLAALAPALSAAKYEDYEPEGEASCTPDDLLTAPDQGIDLLRDPASRWVWLPEQPALWCNGVSIPLPEDIAGLNRLLQGRRVDANCLKQVSPALRDWLCEQVRVGRWLAVDALTDADH